jgi:two-component system, cell cycle sensor histidine kinase and response regulator CckA
MFGFLHKPQATETILDSFVLQCPIAVVEIDNDFRILHANPAFRTLLHIGETTELHPSLLAYFETLDQVRFEEAMRIAEQQSAAQTNLAFPLYTADKQEISVSLNIAVMRHAEHAAARLFVFVVDVTEQKNLELRFVHSQKMQAVGQLAGGVAHDFNNLLTAMIGFCDLLLLRHPAGDPSFADIMQIKQNANRAANLVRQLLAFSRRQTLQPKKLDLTDLLAELSNLIRRLIGENIDLVIHHQRGLWPVKVDQGQLEQVLINLAVNARDAMKEGGTLTIDTRNVTIENADALDKALRIPPQEEVIAPGDYVEVTITDTGTGIPEAVIDNIFEPFFSTKELGSGTGLGLSTVYGIIKQTGGYIYLSTEEGKGTCFFLYIPRLKDEGKLAAPVEGKEAGDTQDLTGAATVMLVEDETAVRIFAARALQNKGYEVLEANCAENGIEVYEANKDKIEVIITDVVMPGLNGPMMIEALDEKFPEAMQRVGVIFMSGYAEDAFADGYKGKREFNFLSKPFTLKQLAAKIKELTKTRSGM